MKSGIVLINKEQNKTSRDVVNDICKLFQTKKVGHTGTLDPLATGVLVVAINEGCKIIEFLQSDEKEYVAEAIVGASSDTLDITGNVQEKDLFVYSKETLEQVLTSFIGTYEQVVPKYSAVHVNGKRLYEYARENTEVALPSRTVEIKEIELLNSDIWGNHQTFSFRVVVSKGTYIRSLIRDIGEKLGSPCIMKKLKRTRQGIFKLEQAKIVQDLSINDIISLKDAMATYPSVVIKEKEVIQKIQNGCVLPSCIEEKTCLLDSKLHLLAIYVPIDGGLMKPIKVFHVSDILN